MRMAHAGQETQIASCFEQVAGAGFAICIPATKSIYLRMFRFFKGRIIDQRQHEDGGINYNDYGKDIKRERTDT